ncbi:zinc knuckle CX2CX4HX4C containing protein [Tanacetum coccineum]|uniref:Zinc knuckle CX2CX4HX4C containing protein n=1 Tax=Tanacetum coccineum TaxID=301880 RepID=A0ABQ5FFB9_9ASTR
MEDANNANAGMNVSGSACFGGEDLLRSVTKRTATRMNKMTGKGDSKVNPKVSIGLDSENAQSQMAVRGSLNPNSGNPNSGPVDANLGGNDQDVGGVASYPDVRRSNYTNTNPNVSEYASLVKHSNVPGNDGFQSGFDSDGTRNASSVPINMHTSSPMDEILIHSIDDVAALFSVPLNSLKEIDDFTKDLEVGKYDLWSKLTKEARSGITDIISNRWDTLLNMQKSVPIVDDSLSGKVSPNDPIVQAMDINAKSTSYAEAAGVSVNISIPGKVVEKVSTHGLEAVMEGGPWLIHNSLIILNQWSMDTRLLKEELTRIPIWVKLHDVPIQVFKEDGISLIVEVNLEADLVDIITIGITSLTGDGFTKETIHVSPPIVTTSNDVTPTVKKTDDGFQMVGNKKKRKGKYEPKATNTGPKKGATNVGNASKSSSMLKSTGTSSKKDNITTSNSYSALENEEEEDEEHIIMAEPLSPGHVFDFPEDDPALNEEEFEEEPEEEPKEEPEEELKDEPEDGPEDGGMDATFWQYIRGRRTLSRVRGPASLSENATTRTRVDSLSRCMDAYDVDMVLIERDATRTTDHVLALEEDNHRLRRRVDSLEVSGTLATRSLDRIEREFVGLRAWVTERLGGGAVKAPLSECIDVMAVYGESRPSEPRGPPDGS